ncbi:hypothetical protein BKA62DRAFT_721553 [Auriculariales sp. MPI-PUGE-AT-0066]|nr:hypothetical protein BKA62DRAFT_721553 [Auriculariales sp. MPI-PUGE-AT-0066]
MILPALSAFGVLPDELLLSIFDWMDTRSLSTLACLSQRLHSVARDHPSFFFTCTLDPYRISSDPEADSIEFAKKIHDIVSNGLSLSIRVAPADVDNRVSDSYVARAREMWPCVLDALGVALQSQRVVALNVTMVPPVFGIAEMRVVLGLLVYPAPLLRCLQLGLHTAVNDDLIPPQLPANLFAGRATIGSVALFKVILPDDPAPAFRGAKSIAVSGCSLWSINVGQHFPQMRRLQVDWDGDMQTAATEQKLNLITSKSIKTLRVHVPRCYTSDSWTQSQLGNLLRDVIPPYITRLTVDGAGWNTLTPAVASMQRRWIPAGPLKLTYTEVERPSLLNGRQLESEYITSALVSSEDKRCERSLRIDFMRGRSAYLSQPSIQMPCIDLFGARVTQLRFPTTYVILARTLMPQLFVLREVHVDLPIVTTSGFWSPPTGPKWLEEAVHVQPSGGEVYEIDPKPPAGIYVPIVLHLHAVCTQTKLPRNAVASLVLDLGQWPGRSRRLRYCVHGFKVSR